MISGAYSNKAMDETAVYEWFRCFKEGWPAEQKANDSLQWGGIHSMYERSSRRIVDEHMTACWNCWCLQEALHCKCPHLWDFDNWLLHHDNKSVHWFLLVLAYLTKNVSPQPSYSPLPSITVPKNCSPLEAMQVLIGSRGQESAVAAFEDVTLKGLQECFQHWYGHWQKCVTAKGWYFAGNKIICYDNKLTQAKVIKLFNCTVCNEHSRLDSYLRVYNYSFTEYWRWP
jgi:hypothetical protein